MMDNHARSATVKVDKFGKVGVIKGRWVDGSEALIDFDAQPRPTLIYVFSPQCTWCERDLENIRFLAGAVKDTHRVIGVSLSDLGLTEYLKQTKLQFPVVKDVTAQTMRFWGFGGTPYTLVVSTQGKLAGAWIGAYTLRQAPLIERQFGVHLPGLVSAERPFSTDK